MSAQRLKATRWRGLGQGVCRLAVGGYVLETDCVGLDVLANEEVLHFDVLASVADAAVVGDVHGALAIDQERGRL